ncbi:hypothetical protein V8E53_004955 [Lactarius tabidus]
MSDTTYDALFWTPMSHVLDVVQQTFSTLSQALPAQLGARMRLDPTEILMDVSKGWFKLIHQFRIYRLKMHIRARPSGTSSQALSDVMRSKVLGKFLKNLWHFTRAYIERRNSTPLPPYVYIAFTHPDLTHRILAKGDICAHMTRHCVRALVVNNLAADINSGMVPDSDAELTCLSSILGSESRDVKICLTRPGIVELVNMASFALGNVDTLKAKDTLLDSLTLLMFSNIPSASSLKLFLLKRTLKDIWIKWSHYPTFL